MIAWEPGEADVSGDPLYVVLTSTGGPAERLSWADMAGPAAVRAKQLEMLEIDVEMSQSWIAFMVSLVERDLTDAEFTAERMARLKHWQKERKRRQHNLHYNYDVRRRPRRLVDRETKKQLAKRGQLLRSKLEELITTVAAVPATQPARLAIAAPDALAEPSASAMETVRKQDAARAAARRRHLLDAIRRDTGIQDPEAATRYELEAAFDAHGVDVGVRETLDEFYNQPEGKTA